MSAPMLLLIVLLVLILFGAPQWNIHPWGYTPSAVLLVVVVVLLCLMLLGRI